MKKISYLVLAFCFCIFVIMFALNFNATSAEEYAASNFKVGVGELNDEDINVLYEYNYLITDTKLNPKSFNLPEGISIKYDERIIDVSEDGIITALRNGTTKMSFCIGDKEVDSIEFYISDKFFYHMFYIVINKDVETRIEDFYISYLFHNCEKLGKEKPYLSYNKEAYKFEYDDELIELRFEGDDLIINPLDKCITDITIKAFGKEEIIHVLSFDINEVITELPDYYIERAKELYKPNVQDGFVNIQHMYDILDIFRDDPIIWTSSNDVFATLGDYVGLAGPLCKNGENIYMAAYDPDTEKVFYFKLEYMSFEDYKKIPLESRNPYTLINDKYLSLYNLNEEDGYNWYVNMQDYCYSFDE
ncbi:MAG: hypothetical protein IJS58_05070 [Bacilli bacterium]|nr:hypothetical protein [Bacilli bacterium]